MPTNQLDVFFLSEPGLFFYHGATRHWVIDFHKADDESRMRDFVLTPERARTVSLSGQVPIVLYQVWEHFLGKMVSSTHYADFTPKLEETFNFEGPGLEKLISHLKKLFPFLDPSMTSSNVSIPYLEELVLHLKELRIYDSLNQRFQDKGTSNDPSFYPRAALKHIYSYLDAAIWFGNDGISEEDRHRVIMPYDTYTYLQKRGYV